ncbi:MAG: hypothetical protein WCE25_02400 [Nitrososphaeraceae archaeon]
MTQRFIGVGISNSYCHVWSKEAISVRPKGNRIGLFDDIPIYGRFDANS